MQPHDTDLPGPETAPRKVIIDTDPGVDDALALLFAMRSPELKIEAITAVAGNVPLDLTVSNALRMVEIAGRTDIPVAAGARAPLRRRLVTATSHGMNGLGGIEFPAPEIKPVDEPAADAIERIVSRSPGEVSIIAVGPLTNVATALQGLYMASETNPRNCPDGRVAFWRQHDAGGGVQYLCGPRGR